MIVKEIVQGKKADLRQLELSDCGGCYADWLNDPDISRYMETKWIVWDQASIQEFVKTQQKSSHSVIFAIVEHETGRHIGNLKIGPIHPQYHHADISYFIGDKKLHGGGTQQKRLASRAGMDLKDWDCTGSKQGRMPVRLLPSGCLKRMDSVKKESLKSRYILKTGISIFSGMRD